MTQHSPEPLPLPPLQRFFIEGRAQEYDGEVVWVDASSALEAAHIAELLYPKDWGRFTRIEWISAETGEVMRFLPNPGDALADLAAVVAARNKNRKV